MRMSRITRGFALVATFVLVLGVLPIQAAANPAVTPTRGAGNGALGDGSSSFALGLMKSMAEGAAGAIGSDLVGWVLGSAGSTDQDLAVLDQISDELDTIENTLVGIENELSEALDAIQQLDCDTWVQTALPYVDAISNLWDPDSVASGDLGAEAPQQSYVGIVAETQGNTITLDEMETWVDQVLNNNDQGIGGLSVLDYLQDLGNVLIPPTGGTGIIDGCLTVSSNSPASFLGQTDDVYYDTVVAPLIDYYYAIQTEGLLMVVEALDFEAWQASGSPMSTPQNIADLAATICGSPAAAAVQYCQNADWAVLGMNGTSGVRGRIAAQLTKGGAPYTTTSDLVGTQPVHTFIGGNPVIYASSPSLFSSLNSTNCPELDSANVCGILKGVWSNTTIGGRYGFYGAGADGVWQAANGSDVTILFWEPLGAPEWTTAYTNVGDYLMRERGFQDLPDDIIFVTADALVVNPFGNVTYEPSAPAVVAFTDTGLTPQNFPPYFTGWDAGNYWNTERSLQLVTSSSSTCDKFSRNGNLPSPSANGSFYVGSSEFCIKVGAGNTLEWEWTSADPPGWSRDPGGATNHPQFRLPVVPMSSLTCNAGLSSTNPAGAPSMCGDDFEAWLDQQVPPAPATTVTDSTCQRAAGGAIDQVSGWRVALTDRDRDGTSDRIRVTKPGTGSWTADVDSVDWNRSSATILGSKKHDQISVSVEDGTSEDRFAVVVTRKGKVVATTNGFVTATASDLQGWQINQPAGGCPSLNEPKPTGGPAGDPDNEGPLGPPPSTQPTLNPIGLAGS
jgi:hypothetical protein